MSTPGRAQDPPPPQSANRPQPGFFGHRPPGGLGLPTQKAKDFKGTVRRLAGYLRPHRAALVLVVVAGALGTIFSVIGPRLLGFATTKIFEGYLAREAGARGATI